jgi:hypothetical protein
VLTALVVYFVLVFVFRMITAHSAKMQRATLNTGATIDVPEFVNVGDVVRVNMMEGGVYAGR